MIGAKIQEICMLVNTAVKILRCVNVVTQNSIWNSRPRYGKYF